MKKYMKYLISIGIILIIFMFISVLCVKYNERKLIKTKKQAVELDESQIKELEKLKHAYEVIYQHNNLTIKYSGGKHNLINVLNFFNENNINWGRVYSELPTLNDVFLEITGKELRDREA